MDKLVESYRINGLEYDVYGVYNADDPDDPDFDYYDVFENGTCVNEGNPFWRKPTFEMIEEYLKSD